MSDELARRDITFSQAEGLAPLPQQLALRELSREARALLWAGFYGSLNSCTRYGQGYGEVSFVNEPWHGIMRRWHVIHEHGYADEFSNDPGTLRALVKALVTNQSFDRTLTFVEFVARDPSCPRDLEKFISDTLVRARCAYRLIDKSIVPVASEADAEAVTRAFSVVSDHRFSGARSHLSAASSKLTEGDWAGSVRESISAVESAARALDPAADALGPALTALERAGTIHGGLKRGFSALYGYTSDAEGIRHALVLQDAASVDEPDALYMFGACAAFVTYLALKLERAK